MVQLIDSSGNSGFNGTNGISFGDGEQSSLFPPGFDFVFRDGGRRGDWVGGVDGLGSESKRMRVMGSNQQIATSTNQSLDSSPLGLTLRKTPSFVELIEMTLAKISKVPSVQTVQNFISEEAKVRCEDYAAQPISEKLKASNFPASVLRIGSWERVSQHEGDLVGKCYYAKRKLVWEVLESGLKSKIEVQWSDICGIRATFRENEAGVLEIELSHVPLFFRETNPQPRKHTLWQATSDFTGGQAPMYRWHYLQFPHGTFEKHYEKLLQCDGRLNALSQGPFPTTDSPYFPSSSGGFQDYSHELNVLRPYPFPGFDRMFKDGYPSQLRPYGAVRSPSQEVQKFEPPRPGIGSNNSTSPCSFVDDPPIEEHCTSKPIQNHKASLWGKGYFENPANYGDANLNWIQELRSIASAHQPMHQRYSSGFCSSNSWDLNKIARHLLLDPVAFGCPDEGKVLAKVKSMCSLLEASSVPDTVSESTGTQLEECSQDLSINDWATSESSEFSDNIGVSPCPNSLSWMPMSSLSENLLGDIPPIASYPYMFLDQAIDEAHIQRNQLR